MSSWPAFSSCLCGVATARLAPGTKPAQVFLCHCSTCRIQSGSFNIPFAALPRAQVDLDTARLTRFRTSAFATRLFCSTCGTFVAMDYDGEAYTVWLALGSQENLPAGWLKPARDRRIFLASGAIWRQDACSLPAAGSELCSYSPDPCAPAGAKPGPEDEALKALMMTQLGPKDQAGAS